MTACRRTGCFVANHCGTCGVDAGGKVWQWRMVLRVMLLGAEVGRIEDRLYLSNYPWTGVQSVHAY
jgi:hypothetical protein